MTANYDNFENYYRLSRQVIVLLGVGSEYLELELWSEYIFTIYGLRDGLSLSLSLSLL